MADAIYESTLPRSGSSAVATSPAGILVSLSDKLDSLVGLIAAGGQALPLPVPCKTRERDSDQPICRQAVNSCSTVCPKHCAP